MNLKNKPYEISKRVRLGLLLLMVAGLMGCSTDPSSDQKGQAEGAYEIVCTTGMIADAVSHVLGERAQVTALMGPGVDPHLYKATQGDLRRLLDADLVFYNGLHLEGKMGEVLEKVARQKPVIAVGERIPQERLLNTTSYAGAYDPHLWFDVSLWADVVEHIGTVMQKQDPANAAFYAANAQGYREELLALHARVREAIATIPEEQRVMITAHDAFEYFGRAYDMEVRGLQGISTLSEYGLRDVSQLVGFIVDRRIKAVFVESSVPRKSLEAVVEGCRQRGHEVRIGGTLYSDAMGAEGTPEGTYTGMVQYNVNTIVSSLK